MIVRSGDDLRHTLRSPITALIEIYALRVSLRLRNPRNRWLRDRGELFYASRGDLILGYVTRSGSGWRAWRSTEVRMNSNLLIPPSGSDRVSFASAERAARELFSVSEGETVIGCRVTPEAGPPIPRQRELAEA